MNVPCAVVLVSGGMDSAVCLAIAKSKGYDIAGLHLNYGQRTEEKELICFNLLCDYYQVKKRLVVNVGYLKQIGGSSLVDENLEVADYTEHREGLPTSYVPFRNANILAIATSWAEVIKANYIFIGASQVDYSGYPDCRDEFFRNFQKVIDTGTNPINKIEIVTPLINMSKKDIILKGKELGVPFELTWSCYKYNEKACGVCESCYLRLKGFREANLIDPIEYINVAM